MRTIERILKECDVILKVADARNPKTLFRLKTRKRTITVLNKIDLVGPSQLEALRRKYRNAVFMSARKRKGKGALMHRLVHITKVLGRGITVGVVGYPNVGKSSIINMLKGKRSARVSATPGETKGIQWLRIKKDILMYDSPGVIMKKAGENELAKMFALSPENVKDPEGVAESIIEHLVRAGKGSVLEREYGIAVEEGDSHALLKKIAERHRMLVKGGNLDLDRAAKKVIRDWQRGRLGNR